MIGLVALSTAERIFADLWVDVDCKGGCLGLFPVQEPQVQTPKTSKAAAYPRSSLKRLGRTSCFLYMQTLAEVRNLVIG